MNILIVEDDRLIALMLSRMVEEMGHQVVDTLTKGEEAIKSVNSRMIDLILMDIRLKGTIDGIEAIKQIQTSHDIPVIFITGNSDEKTMARASETNYIAYLVKPVMVEQLEDAIYKV